jgi:hypothetical protein
VSGIHPGLGVLAVGERPGGARRTPFAAGVLLGIRHRISAAEGSARCYRRFVRLSGRVDLRRGRDRRIRRCATVLRARRAAFAGSAGDRQ